MLNRQQIKFAEVFVPQPSIRDEPSPGGWGRGGRCVCVCEGKGGEEGGGGRSKDLGRITWFSVEKKK